MGRRREWTHVGRPRPAQARAAGDQDATEAGTEAVPRSKRQRSTAQRTAG